MDIPTDLITQFCRVTNADEALASQLLRDSGLDLQDAISSFFAIQDAGGLPSVTPNDRPSTPLQENDAEVQREPPRAPPPTSRFPPSVRPPSRHSGGIDRTFRNHAHGQNSHSRMDPFLDNVEAGDVRGEALASLFRPPVHLIHTGTLDEAMAAGRSQGRWVLINIQQSDIFACHTMNRDVWSDSTVQELIQAHFVFWQRDVGNASDYSRFYDVGDPPHIAVVDPRNGERVRVWGADGQAVGKIQLLDALQDFVSGNSLDSDAAIRGRNIGSSARSSRAQRADSNPTSSRDYGRASAGASIDVVEIDDDDDDDDHVDLAMNGTSEDAQLAAAIAASIEDAETERANSIDVGEMQREASRLLSATDPALSQSRSLRAEQDSAFQEALMLDRAKEESERAEQLRIEKQRQEEKRREEEKVALREMKRKRVPAPPEDGTREKVTELVIRLPDGKRLQRKFFATDNVGNVYDFIECEVEQLDGVVFDLMTPYPKRSYSDRSTLLSELAPKAALVVHRHE